MANVLLWEINVFRAVAEARSFVAAAKKMGCSPSAVTRAIQSLEAILNIELFRRNRKVVSLTSAGEIYYRYAVLMTSAQEEAIEELGSRGGALQGWMRFSAPETMGLTLLPYVLNRISARFPKLKFEVRFTDEMLDPVEEGLDFAIRGGFPQSSELIGYSLIDYSRSLFASPEYVRSAGAPVSPEDVQHHSVILHTGPRILKDWYFSNETERIRVHVEPRFRFSSGSAVYMGVRNGLGVARLASWLVEEDVQKGRLMPVCSDYSVTAATGQHPQLHAVYARATASKRVRGFLEVLQGEVRAACEHHKWGLEK